MKFGVRILPGQLAKNPFYVLLAVCFFFCLAYELAHYVIADDLATLAFIVIIIIVIAGIIAIVDNWRRGVYFLAVWILFEDLIRKYLGNNMVIYFAKDALALIVYFSFFRSHLDKEARKFRIPFRIALLMFIWFGLLQVFNPASTSIFYGILGMKVDFLYVPLIFVGYALLRNEEDLRRIFSSACILILIVAGLGLVQSIIGHTFLNPPTLQQDIRELSTLYRISPISGAVAYRPTSVFVSSGRFIDFLIVAWLISLGYASYLLLRCKKGRTLAFITVGLVAAASIMSASRGVFMWEAGIGLVVTAGFIWGAPWRQGEALRVLRAIQRSILLVGIAIILLLTIFPEEIGSRLAIYSETLMPNSSASELVTRTRTYPLQQLSDAFDHPRWPYGYGIGTCTLGTQYVTRIMHATPMRVAVESGFGNLIVELGVVGLILWIVLGFSISYSAWRVVKELRGTPWFPLAFVIFLFGLLLFFPMAYTSSATYQDFVINAYFWVLLGIFYRLRVFNQAVQAQVVPRQG
jgi:hypothetical protein